MVKDPPNERVVYLALKNIVRGADAQIRNEKPIRKLIEKHQARIDVHSLIQRHSLDSVCDVAKILLKQQIFESTLKAKLRFPEAFEVSPAQTAMRSISEAEAAKMEAEAIREAGTGYKGQSILQEDQSRADAAEQWKEGKFYMTVSGPGLQTH